MRSKILIIYTGGTIGMVRNLETGAFQPFNFEHLYDQVPEIKQFDFDISVESFDDPIDSSDINPEIWAKLAYKIEERYAEFDGFVILHGSDTMAFTASALSYMLKGLNKPVILTGSQLPIGVIRTDGKENLITAIEIAGMKEMGMPVVSEVAVYFEYQLYRGNRTHKANAEHFEAFDSPNYPPLANAGVHINFDRNAIKPYRESSLSVQAVFDPNIAILKLFPGITSTVVNVLTKHPDVKAIILETYGSGNATKQAWFIEALSEAIAAGKVIINVTQCERGSVEQGRYETSTQLKEIGVISAFDMTTEATLTKLMHVIGAGQTNAEIRDSFHQSFCGEVTFPASM